MNLSVNRNGQKATDTNMNGNKILFIAAAAAAVLTVIYILWNSGCLLPLWIDWKDTTLYTDTGDPKEIVLEHKTIRLINDTDVIWTMPKDIKVQDAAYCDIDSDGNKELILLCWKVGRYGEDKPFWVKRDEKKWSQHIFVYTVNDGKIKPKWMSSYIGQDVSQMNIYKQHLLLTAPNGQTSGWIWDSWGFTREDIDISFTVFGDNLIHEPIYRYGLDNAEGFDFLYENVKDIISESDISVINQETPLTDEAGKYSGYPRFGTPVEVGQAIADAGFDIVTCATNHACDKGVSGITFTKKFFDEHNILCLGIQSENEDEYVPYKMISRGNTKFALFNYTYGSNGFSFPDDKSYMLHILNDKEQIQADIKDAKTKADIIMMFVHWGTEYNEQPDEMQKEWTQVFLESGVDIVVGTHPHVLQPYEMLCDDSGHKMLVYYSIGNYISAQKEKECIKGGMAQFTISLTQDGYEIEDYTLKPLMITRQKGGKYTTSLPPSCNDY